MDEIFQQWNDGMITDAEFSMKMLDEYHKQAAKYLELMSKAVSIQLGRDTEKFWFHILNPEDVKTKAPSMLMKPYEAEQLNRYLKPGYIWHSDVATSVAKGDLATF